MARPQRGIYWAYWGIFGLACASQQRPERSSFEGQTYAEAIRLMCDVDRLVSVPEGTNELELGQLREDYLVENTKHPEAIFLLTVWRTKPVNEQASLLKREALEQRVSDCALARRLEAEGAPQ